jgi:Tfp pilus assembly protein PilV
MKQKKKQAGFSLIEAVISLTILLIGVLGTISALTMSQLYIMEAEKRSFSKEIARSTLETIFSLRDMLAFDPQSNGTVYNWDSLQTVNGSVGIFLSGWNPVRESPGADGIYGTADDACAGTGGCAGNTSAVMQGFERRIEFADITENGVVRKRRITVRVRYFVGTVQREESESTIIANLPVN